VGLRLGWGGSDDTRKRKEADPGAVGVPRAHPPPPVDGSPRRRQSPGVRNAVGARVRRGVCGERRARCVGGGGGSGWAGAGRAMVQAPAREEEEDWAAGDEGHRGNDKRPRTEPSGSVAAAAAVSPAPPPRAAVETKPADLYGDFDEEGGDIFDL
jgi:hypothetical protein